MIYRDSSALLKLLFEESESAALALWISEQAGKAMVSSELARVEVIRAARLLDAEVVPAARVLMSQLDLIPLTSGVIAEAADVGEPLLRTLDAIHLASALSIQAHLTALVAYDNHLVAAAKAAGIETIQPSAGCRESVPHHSPGDEATRARRVVTRGSASGAPT